MLRRYMPAWAKNERTEFVLEVVSAVALAFSTTWWWLS